MIVQNILNEVSKELKGLSGIVGVVLGGSRASRTHEQNSDRDLL